jgi:hypothetical protein
LELRSDFRIFRCYSYGCNYATIWAGTDALRVFRIDPQISYISDRWARCLHPRVRLLSPSSLEEAPQEVSPCRERPPHLGPHTRVGVVEVCFALQGYNDPDSHCRKRKREFDISRKVDDGPCINLGDIHPEDGLIGRTSDA